ncbi:MAG: carboxypeptidase-like regulatory domain-containing protein [Bacillota bacterium]
MTEHPAADPSNRVAQENHQTLHVHIHNGPKAVDLSGRILGTVQEAGALPLAGCEIQLFFGPIGEHAVATSRTDANGSFAFGELPPGFYGLRLSLPGSQVVCLHNLRVLPGETCQPRVVLSGQPRANRLASGAEAESEFIVRGIRMADLR